MARRKVTASRKGKRRRILGVSGPSLDYRTAEAVALDIQEGVHRYYVREAPYESEVRAVEGADEVRLVASRDILPRPRPPTLLRTRRDQRPRRPLRFSNQLPGTLSIPPLWQPPASGMSAIGPR